MLIVTIIVIIILAAAVILTITKNNPVSSAKEATFKEDMSNIQDELSMYLSKKYTDNPTSF
ncbi:unknown [Clostridium sp. CAG:465]|nr:unknown [Clostridium sp. CAG:465]